jgi:hypothetical protein
MGQDARVLRVIARIAGASAAALVVFLVVPLDHDLAMVVAIVVLLGILLLLLPLTVRHALRIERSKEPLVDAAQSLCTLLALLVIGFATVHYATEQQFADQYAGLETKIDALYFSMTMVSTVGFGDITAAGQGARVVVTLQMLFDLVFVGVAIRLLGRALGARGEEFRSREP